MGVESDSMIKIIINPDDEASIYEQSYQVRYGRVFQKLSKWRLVV